jgi:hypothetical protein
VSPGFACCRCGGWDRGTEHQHAASCKGWAARYDRALRRASSEKRLVELGRGDLRRLRRLITRACWWGAWGVAGGRRPPQGIARAAWERASASWGLAA